MNWTVNSGEDWNESVAQYTRMKTSLESIETPVLLSIGLMGFIGACFSLAIFISERASANDYFLYKIISSCEAAQMLALTIVRLTSYLKCERNYVCSFFWAHISICVMNTCADVVDFLILFLCIERTWACLLPFAFKNVNRRFLERSVVIFAFIFMIVFSIFQAFEVTLQYDPEADRYRDSPSQFAESKFYSAIIVVNSIRFYVTAFAIALAMMFSIFGFWRTARRSQQVTKNRDKKREMDLCCLQLCTAAPVVVNHLLYAISLRFGHYAFMLDQTGSERRELAERIRKAEAFEYLKLSTNISDALAHALQFYFYLLFCPKIRQEFLALWKCEEKPILRSRATSKLEEVPMLKKETARHTRIGTEG